ncbi:phage major capsid protein [Streptomyces sp. NPDC005251]|uniref:phage major capsid protein n=1 Tax=Streptomyces sp. NPDC005251 TaxID=3157166 RepID=UPI0033AC1EF0
MNKRELITDLLAKEAASKADLKRILDVAKKFNRDLSSGEKTRFEEAERGLDEIHDRVSELREQIAADEAAAPMARRYAPKITSVREAGVYHRGGEFSYFRDLHNSRNGDFDAAERLRRNAAEQRGVTTGNGSGGSFVPPAYLVDEWISLARGGRTTADLCYSQDLPSGTDLLSVPKITTGSSVAAQNGELTALSQTDIATASVTSPVVTLGGTQLVSVQMLEQSAGSVDQVVMADLAAEYGRALDNQVLNGSGTNGQLTGLLTLSGTTSVTWTQASPAVTGSGQLWGTIANTISQIHAARYASPDCIIMHPRRWAWIEAAIDTTNRPLIAPSALNGPNNALGVAGAVAAQGHVGTLQGLPVFTDPLIPTNLGAGTNQDVILVARMQDVMRWESTPKFETFTQPFAGQMGVLFRAYAYGGLAARYAPSVGKITGTGLVTPSF